MVFSSLLFLFGFLPGFLLLYYAAPGRARNWVAMAGSLLFYAWGAPRFVILLLVSCLVDFEVGRRLTPPTVRRRAWLAVGLVSNVAVLLYFKYANFLVGQCNAMLQAAGLSPLGWTAVALPIGISFFTFQKISYLVDVYRGTARPASSFQDYVLYVILFPQLIAGPIVRYHDVAAQIAHRDHTAERFASGVFRFCLGLGKKVLLANTLGEVADRAFGAGPDALGCASAWIGLLAYSFQIFFDFAGYSDMAIGLGRMIGIEFLENFNAPYISRSFTEFWRRWHISLSNFMKEYLYVPLGGNRSGEFRTYANLWIVFLISGFWHGAAWNFVIWGAYHGIFLSLDKFFRKWGGRVPAVVAVPGTFVLVMFGWVFFRAESLSAAVAYFHALFGVAVPSSPLAPGSLLAPHARLAMVVAAVCSFLPAIRISGVDPDTLSFRTLGVRGQAAVGAGALLLLVLSSMVLAAGGFNPFIYFRF